LALGFAASALSVAPGQAQQMCGGKSYPFPYTDVSGVVTFCPGIMEAYVTGISQGTTATTFSPSSTVIRSEMTTFLQRSVDQVLTRASRRTALKQTYTNTLQQFVDLTHRPVFCAADGPNVWVAATDSVVKVDAATGTVLGTYTGATKAWPIFVTTVDIVTADNASPNHLYEIFPSNSPGPMGDPGIPLPDGTSGMAFDGSSLWTANFSGSVSIINIIASTISTVSSGFNQPVGILYDGSHIWVTDHGAGTLLQLDSMGNILQTVTVGAGPQQPVYDGQNIWVPNNTGNSITVVQASSGNIVATIAADATNLLSGPRTIAFDGERILVTNDVGNSLTLFKAADLSFIANIPLSFSPYGACSDGTYFWVTVPSLNRLLRL
jgi:hypothetical protein